MPKKKAKKSASLAKYIAILVILGTIAYGAYAVYTFQHSEENTQGFFTCDKEGKVCQLSQHIHADIEANICGREVTFEKEKGRTDQTHTHKESNKIHWHAPLKVDPQTRLPLDPKPLQVSSFLAQMDFTLAACPQNPNPDLKVTVNGLDMPSKLDYVWQDGDKIELRYK